MLGDSLHPRVQRENYIRHTTWAVPLLNDLFGLHGAGGDLSKTNQPVLLLHGLYAAAYLDDMVIYNHDWDSYLSLIATVLQSIARASLTTNPA